MASLADMRVVRTIETRATTSGVQQTTAELKGLAAAHGQVGQAATASATVTESAARRQGSLAGAYERERRALDPLIAAREKYERTMRNLDRGLAAGADFGEYTRLAGVAQQRFERLAGANDNLTKSVGLQRHEWVNLGRQMQDVGTMAAMGASGMQILTSQAAQVYDVLASSQGGVKGALKEIGTSIVGLATPGRLAFAAIATGAGIAAVAMSRAASQAAEVNRALRLGAGLRSGMTAGDIDALSSNAPGLSRSEGRAGALAFGSTGASRANTATALGLSYGLAGAMYDGDVTAAQKGLADAMRGGTSSLLRYVDNIRPLGAATVDWVEKIAASQGEQAANAELLRILNDGIKAAGIEVPLWKQGLTKLGNAASDLADEFLKEAARRASTTMREVQAIAGALSGSSRDVRGGNPAIVGSNRGPMGQARFGAEGVAGAGAGVAGGSDLSAVIERGINGSGKLLGLNKSYDADGESLRKLRLDLSEYDRLLKDNAVTQQMTTEQLEAARKAREELAGAIESNLNAEEKRRQSDALTLRSINARTDAERTAIAVEQKRLELAGQRLTAEERQRALDAVRTQEEARNARAVEDRRRRLDEMNMALDTQRKAFGLSDEAAETLRSRTEMLTEAARNNQTVTERYGAGWETLAGQMAKAKVATDDLTRSQQNVIQGMDEMRSGTRGAFTGVFSDLRQGKDPTQTLVSAFGRMADQNFDRMISKPLTEMMMGRDGQPGGGLFGNFLSSGMTQTASMTVSAGVVNIGGAGSLAGGVPGLGGVGGTAGAAAATSGSGGVLGTLMAPFAAAQKIVTDGAGRVLSFGRGVDASPSVVAGGGSPAPAIPQFSSEDLKLLGPRLGSFGFGVPAGQAVGGSSAIAGAGRTITGIPLSSISADGKHTLVDSAYASRFQGFLNDLSGGGYKINELGGYNYRTIAGTNVLSNHAFGQAIDINQAVNPHVPWGRPRVTDMPSDVGDRAAAWGLNWGGNWKNRPDAMHFEVNKQWQGPPIPEKLMAPVEQFDTALTKATDSVGGLGSSAAGAAEKLASSLGDALGKVGSGGFNIGGVGGLLGGGAGAGETVTVPGFANGTDFAPGGPAIVGERGIELIDLPRGSKVTPTHLADARMAPLRAAPTSLVYNEAPMTANSAAGVTPEEWLAARRQDRAEIMRDLGRNFGRMGGENAMRFG